MPSKTITIRCRAFSHEGVRENTLRVDADGTVRVWDSVAGHYTTCHALSAGVLRRARKAASVA